MADLTDIQRMEVRNTARIILDKPYDHSAPACELASFILATVDAPAPTLAEELRHIAEHWEEWATDTITSAIRAAADRAEQIEEERDMEKTISKGWMEAHQKLAEHHAETLERDGQKGAESNAEAPNPADVKPGEAWIVEVEGERRTAVKDRADIQPWNTVNAGGWLLTEDDEDVTPVTRLVSAPRVITNPDELDALAEGSIVRDNEGDPATRRAGGLDYRGVEGVCNDVHHYLPVTVLWEPEA